MASIQKFFKYDVFLSFSGDDNRRSFVDHLYHALQDEGIITYKDDETIKKGERINEQLIRSIEESRSYIIVFSKNYASSSRFLDELVKIMECQKTMEHTAYPVFFDVEPIDVRNVGKTFAKHAKTEAASRWRYALIEATRLTGWELKTFDGRETKLIQKIVEDIILNLGFNNLSLDGKGIKGIHSMASASSSFIQKSFKYDVFLSFHKGDTCKNFVDHLYHELHGKGIKTYKEYETNENRRKFIDDLVRFRSIEDSRIHIIVFTKNYASSSRCLHELVRIMECHKTTKQTAYPIFYDVEPAEVHHQSGAVREAFAKHENEEVTRRWKDALKEAANLTGWELNTTVYGHEANFIKEIVEYILLKLSSIIQSVGKNLVGMETRVKNVVSSLDIGVEDVRIIGIKGMGGGGKTTLARAVFDRISSCFEGKSFVENVREVSNVSGFKGLRKQVLQDVLKDQNISFMRVIKEEMYMKRLMGSGKVLVVLDDVDHIDQLEALAGDPKWFKPGSRIIITTRDEQVLMAHGVKFILDVNLLSYEEAIRLFCRHAFQREIPNQGYEKLSKKVVHYAAGLPLTIEVLGSRLCGKSELEWRAAIKRLKTVPLGVTLGRLELSYNGLKDDQKEMFLDVACILKGETKDRAIRILESCGYHAKIGLRVLEQKSLITISNDGRLLLHNQIAEMGRHIVRREHPDEPHKHDRLWVKEEIEYILNNDLGTRATRSIKLLNTNLSPDVIMNGLTKMKDLRFVHVDNKIKNYAYTSPSSYRCGSLPNALSYLYWCGYPLSCLPESFQLKNLVNLEMPHSNISKLWEGGNGKVLNKLKFLDLSYAKLTTFDLRITPDLEELHLENCYDLVELCMPVDCPKLKILCLKGIRVSELDLGLFPSLEELHLEKCYDLERLRMFVECPKLKTLWLKGSMVRKFNLGMTPKLEELHLVKCYDFVELRMPVECPKLKILQLGDSKVSSLNLGLSPSLEELHLDNCYKLVELHMPVECPKLKTLCLKGSRVSNLNLGLTPLLKNLDLKECFHLKEIQASVGCLKKLFYLNSDFVEPGGDASAKLKVKAKSLDLCPLHPNNNLPEFQFECFYDEPRPLTSGNFEKLISFGVCACTSLESFSATICDLKCLGKLTLEGGIQEAPKDLYKLERLEELTLSMKKIKRLPDSICMLKHLKSLALISCFLLEQLPKGLGCLECLEKLHLSDCTSLQDIPDSVCMMKCLRSLHLPYCVLVDKLPDELGSSMCLEELNIEGTGIYQLPHSIVESKGLCIIWSKGRLESYGFKSLKKLSKYTASCIV